MSTPADHPDVIAPPPLIFAAAVVLGLLLEWMLPVYVLSVLFYGTGRIIIGLVLIVAGAALGIAAERTFRAAGTNTPPWKPALNLATSGVFRYLRNPMYVGMTLMVAGLAITLASDWMLVLLVPAVLVTHYGVVLREERYLEQKFGERYRRYKTAVTRYGWPEM
jgi:protein-S-isoprenylcysteine O-methyltransferase Ste14